ncbi:MAG: AAA family ATPase [Spirochaetota bacterium]|nr:AAA family ATPase [Spirochaetota bacterium]
MEKTGVYTSSGEHLKDELERLDLILELCLGRKKDVNVLADQEISGLYIPENEVRELLKRNVVAGLNPEEEQTVSEIKGLREAIDEKLIRTVEEGYLLPLDQMRRQFELSEIEMDIVLILLAPAIDLKYEKIYAYIQDDISKIHATAALVMRLLFHAPEDQAFIRHCLSKRRALRKWGIVKMENPGVDGVLISQRLSIDERMVDFMVGAGGLSSESVDYLEVMNPGEGLEDMALDGALKEKIENITAYLASERSDESSHLLYFKGLKGSGRMSVAKAVCDRLNMVVLKLDMLGLSKYSDLEVTDIICDTVRELILAQGALVLEHFEEFMTGERKVTEIKNKLLKELSEHSWLTIIVGSQNTLSLRDWPARYLELDFSIPGYALRKEIWEKYISGLNGHGESLTELSAGRLAAMYQFTEGQIRGAVSYAVDRSLSQKDEGESFDKNLLSGCRVECNQALSELARKVKSPFGWDDIVLSDEQKTQLKEITLYLRHKYQVYDKWQFKRKVSSGRGVNALFSGVSGTGKTMSASVIANELRLELYKIDLSSVVSKYIGETEKNLNRIFTEAETSNAVLFFDEADALFGKRSEIKDSHDRYANIETGYLLQKMDDYEGMCILATNLRQNMDEAFTRRMQFIVEFHSPDERERRKIWQRIYPSETPLSDDIDFDFLSERLKLSGGHIKNMALGSAFYAAAEKSSVGMSHIIRAAKREYQKLGKAFMKKDFEPYDSIV